MNEHEGVPSANWRWTSVGELGDVSGGVTKNSSKTHLAIKLPYLRVANVYANELRLDDIAEIGVTQAESVRALLVKGDLLVVEGNGSLDQIGRVALWNGAISPCLHQNHLIKVRFGVSDLGPFVLYWLMSPEGREQVVRAASSTSGLHTLSLSKVASLPAPIAPLPEQQRIVEAIESYFTRLNDAVATIERVQRNLKRHRASVLKAAVEGRLVPTEAELARAGNRDYEPASVLLEHIFAERRRRWEETGRRGQYEEPVAPDTTDLPELPEGWCWASLEALTSAVRVICYGILMPKEHVPGGVLYVKVRDMRSGTLDVAALQRTAPEIAAKFSRAALNAGDLLLAIRGTYGRVVDVPPELEGGNITQDTARLDLMKGCTSRYIKASLLSPPVQSYLKRVARGVAVKGVNIADVRATPIALPPTAEQVRIAIEAERLLSVSEVAERIAEQSIRRGTRLRQSILKWAFEGRLADQDPSDESASVLLERIRTETAAQMANATSGASPKRRGRRGTMTGAKHTIG